MTDPQSRPAPRVRRPGARPNRTDDPLLPDTTSDERDVGWGDTAEDDDERLLREVPPHHGG